MSSFPSPSKAFAVITCLALTYACGTSLYLPGPETTSSAEQLEEMMAGRKLYIHHCGSCHNLYKPEEFSKEKWMHQVDEMKVRAKVTDEQAHLIAQYLTGYAETSN